MTNKPLTTAEPLVDWWPDVQDTDQRYGRPNPGSLAAKAAADPVLAAKIRAGRRESLHDHKEMRRWSMGDFQSGLQVLG